MLEAETIARGIADHRDYLTSLVDCVELPGKLQAHQAVANLDSSYEREFDEWMWFLSNEDLVLPVERCCDEVGMLLPWDMRGVRVRDLPPILLDKLHVFFRRCPAHTQALLVHFVCWLVRFERIGRTGSVGWSPPTSSCLPLSPVHPGGSRTRLTW